MSAVERLSRGLADSRGPRLSGDIPQSARALQKASKPLIAVDLGGRVVRMLALPLDGLADGDYDLALDVVDQGSGRRLEAHERFTVEGNAKPSAK
jgi:hypothetical protein